MAEPLTIQYEGERYKLTKKQLKRIQDEGPEAIRKMGLTPMEKLKIRPKRTPQKSTTVTSSRG